MPLYIRHLPGQPSKIIDELVSEKPNGTGIANAARDTIRNWGA